jgi:hypothetical protein
MHQLLMLSLFSLALRRTATFQYTVCSVSFIVCAALCAVLFERGVSFCVLCPTAVPLPPGKN